ncbi:metallophosphoesterase [bacterium]|nr:metallophosphoesterase [bacterium]
MSFLRGSKASLEKLNSSRMQLLAAEGELMALRDIILVQKQEQERQQQNLQALKESNQNHHDEAEQQASIKRSYQQEIENLQQQIATLRGLIDAADVARERHHAEAKRLAAEIDAEQQTNEQLTKEIEAKSEEFTEHRDGLKSFNASFMKASMADRKKRHSGPSAGTVNLAPNDQTIQTLHALGDVHGWAPGLINYLQAHGLANISIGGRHLVEDEMATLFPDPMARIAEQRALPRMGLDGQPLRSEDIHTNFHRVEVDEQHNGGALICLGDLVDRGDHNEIVLEILRQSILQNMGMRWMLLGNHEQMLLENDFNRWAKNEFNYMAEPNKEHAGSFLHQPALTGCGTVDDGLNMNFKILQGGLGATLLAQHLALVASLESPSKAAYQKLVKPIFDELKLKHAEIEHAMKESKWVIHEMGYQFIKGIRKLSEEEEIIIPGAIGLAMYERHLFVHAEPNGLKSLNQSLVEDLSTMHTKNGLSFAFPRFYRGRILEASFLWARGWKKESESLRNVLEATALVNVDTIVHGHQAGPGIRTEQSEDTSPVIVVAADEGMTPYYFYNYGHFSEAYNPLRVPEGYREVVK